MRVESIAMLYPLLSLQKEVYYFIFYFFTNMKTLNDYILDAQHKEAKFLSATNGLVATTQLSYADVMERNEQYRNMENSQRDVSPYTYITKDGRMIPCHNKATFDFYKREEESGRSIV